MRLVFLTRSLGPGGAERQLVSLARGLASRGHDVRVGVFYGGGALQDELLAAGVDVRDLAKRHRWDVFGFLRRLSAFLAEQPADVVHGYLVAPNLLAALFRGRLGGARVVWGIRASNMDLDRYDRLARFTFAASRALAFRADLIIVNSESGLDYHRAQGFPAESMICIPNGIDTARFRSDPELRRAGRRRLSVDEQVPVIGRVGRLDPMKDYDTFLAAAARLGHERPDVRFVCVGDGPARYRHRLERRAGELGIAERVQWCGAQQEMPELFNAFDVATSSSAFGEGFPNVLGEAMACGVPCVTTDVGDSAALLGGLGPVVPPGDPGRLASAWTECLAAARDTLGARLRSRIEHEFSVATLVDRTEHALAGVAAS